jgi:putative FmdB family regulatory protein
MPTYEYQCKGCNKSFTELFLTQAAVVREEPETKCPACGSTEKQRLAGLPTSGARFKGRGWTRKRGA